MKTLIIRSKVRFFLGIFLILLTFIQCGDKEENPFPYVPVNATFYLSGRLTNMLVGEYRVIDGYGLGGLIIFRKGTSEFVAFDRACTFEGSSDCVLTDDGSMFECPCCGSRFWMVNNDIAGTVYQGPARFPLQQYRCYFDGLNTVRVTN